MNADLPSDDAGSDAAAAPVAQKRAEAAALISFPVVGIGASAGGLAAFEAFFSGMPSAADPDMAFVLVQHLAPDHKSLLTELIQRCTRMPVFEVEDGMAVQPNCAYITPPNRDMAFLGGRLQLLEPGAPRGERLPIDFFFRSLAQDQHERAIGIVLSGNGSDGSQGVRAIKAEGGMVVSQSTASSEFDGMPRAALATGLVDYELAPAEMPARLMAYAAHAFGLLPQRALQETSGAAALSKVFALLRAQTGHDFSLYKPSTIHRRIDRRMAVHQVGTLVGYVKYLQQTPAEIDALFRDLLIGVTHFFRDPDAFAALAAQGLPLLFKGVQPGGTLRAWVPGCSTGEEAYSIAMLLADGLAAVQPSPAVQVFATDIDGQAIATARAGIYPAIIAQDVGTDRLARFSSAEAEGGAWRIHKRVRDLLVFSEHDVVRDPPFSRLDLVSCRNLLIYMEPELQRRLIQRFHYALKPGGLLFLGSSEGLGDADNLFAVVDRKAKLYRRLADPAGLRRLGAGPALPVRASPPPSFVHHRAPVPGAAPSPRELAEQALLQHVVPAAALVTARGEVVYLHGRSGLFLEPAVGEPGAGNILKMARDGLRSGLSSALQRAAATGDVARAWNLRVKSNGHHTQVNLSVRPLAARAETATDAAVPTQPGLFLVTLEEALAPAPAEGVAPEPSVAHAQADGSLPSADARIVDLLREMCDREETLQSTSEELQTANEELMSSNEELQSTNEELETSKEELQSVNEELATVNAELTTKVTGLTRANNDMNNLLAGTGIGTLFVDHALHILRFTPAAAQIINLISGDVGRPVGHIVSNLVGYDLLVADIQTMLNTLVPKQIEVQTVAGQWYTLRIQPYRTLDNVVEGAVISFVDITAMVQTRESLRDATELAQLAAGARELVDALTVCDLDGRITAWNPAAEKLFGWSEAEALAMNLRDRVPPVQREQLAAALSHLRDGALPQPGLAQRLTKAGKVLEVTVYTSVLADAAGNIYALATIERAAGAPAVIERSAGVASL